MKTKKDDCEKSWFDKNKSWLISSLVSIVVIIAGSYGTFKYTAGANSVRLNSIEKTVELNKHDQMMYQEKNEGQMKSINHNFEMILNLLYRDTVYKKNVNAILKEVCKTNEVNKKLYEILIEQNKSRSYNLWSNPDTVKYLYAN